jgi:hypothetical protein
MGSGSLLAAGAVVVVYRAATLKTPSELAPWKGATTLALSEPA